MTEGADQEQEQGMHAHGREERHLAERPRQQSDREARFEEGDS